MSSYEFLYGRRCRSPLCWEDIGEATVTGSEIVVQSAEQVKMVRERLRIAQERQKHWADNRRRPLEFAVGDRVFLKVSPFHGVHRFGVKGKLSPKYIGPFEITERIGEVSYRLQLPDSIEGVHDVFHVSQLRRYLSDPSHVIDQAELHLEPDLTFVEQPVKIVDQRSKSLRNQSIPLVCIEWSRGDSTWEREDQMKQQYPHLFEA